METFDVAFICDERYVMPTVVAINSLIDNMTDRQNLLRIHICTYMLEEKSIMKLKKCEKDNVAIIVHDLSNDADYNKKIKLIQQMSHVSPTALLKFELAKIIESDKVLYLDSDIIVCKDLRELLSMDLEGYLGAASYDFWKCQMAVYEFEKDLVIPDFYFNSGVMLLNLKKMREENIDRILWETKMRRISDVNNTSTLMDQDCFNDVFKGKCKSLQIKYNCNVRFTHDVDLELINAVYGTSYANVCDISTDAVILHYVGKSDKPWLFSNSSCLDVWDKYYEKSGYLLSDLKRIKYKTGLMKKIINLLQRLERYGLRKTVLYLLNR